MFANKRLLVLGGSNFQLPIIKRAKEMGVYVITCDYLPDNPGHKLSDEYHNISTTDKEAVLTLAKTLSIDAILTLSSDPAIPTVAYVSNALGLNGPSPDAVASLTEKDLFRSLLFRLGLNLPKYYVVSSATIPKEIIGSSLKFVVKPVDSCGSKGVTLSTTNTYELTQAINYALVNSRAGRCILEEFIAGDQVHGDGYLEDGKLMYYYLGDHVLYTKTKSFIPTSTRWPCKYNKEVLDEIASQVEKISKASGYIIGSVNIEARVTDKGEVYIIEVGPRNGGNYVPIIQEHLTGFDFVNKIICDAFGWSKAAMSFNALHDYKVGAHYILHSDKSGVFKKLHISDKIKRNVFFHNVFKEKGEPVSEYAGSNASIGVLLLEFKGVDERDKIMSEIDELVQVEIE